MSLCDWSQFPSFPAEEQERILNSILGITEQFRMYVGVQARCGRHLTKKELYQAGVKREYWDQFKEIDPEQLSLSREEYMDENLDDQTLLRGSNDGELWTRDRLRRREGESDQTTTAGVQINEQDDQVDGTRDQVEYPEEVDLTSRETVVRMLGELKGVVNETREDVAGRIARVEEREEKLAAEMRSEIRIISQDHMRAQLEVSDKINTNRRTSEEMVDRKLADFKTELCNLVEARDGDARQTKIDIIKHFESITDHVKDMVKNQSEVTSSHARQMHLLQTQIQQREAQERILRAENDVQNDRIKTLSARIDKLDDWNPAWISMYAFFARMTANSVTPPPPAPCFSSTGTSEQQVPEGATNAPPNRSLPTPAPIHPTVVVHPPNIPVPPTSTPIPNPIPGPNPSLFPDPNPPPTLSSEEAQQQQLAAAVAVAVQHYAATTRQPQTTTQRAAEEAAVAAAIAAHQRAVATAAAAADAAAQQQAQQQAAAAAAAAQRQAAADAAAQQQAQQQAAAAVAAAQQQAAAEAAAQWQAQQQAAAAAAAAATGVAGGVGVPGHALMLPHAAYPPAAVMPTAHPAATPMAYPAATPMAYPAAAEPYTDRDRRYKCNLRQPEYDGKKNILFYISEFEDFVKSTNVPKEYWKVHLNTALREGSKRGLKSCALEEFLNTTVIADLTYEQLVEKLKAQFLPKVLNTARQRLQAAEQKPSESLADWHRRLFTLYNEALQSRTTKGGNIDIRNELFVCARAQFIQRMYDPDLKLMCTAQMHTSAPNDFDMLLEWAQVIQDSVQERRAKMRGTSGVLSKVVPHEAPVHFVPTAYAVSHSSPKRKVPGSPKTPKRADIETIINSLVQAWSGHTSEEDDADRSVQPYRGGRGARGNRGGYKNGNRGKGRGRGGTDRSFDSQSSRGSGAGGRTHERATVTEVTESQKPEN